MKIWGLKRKRRYAVGDYVVFRHGHRTVLGKITYVSRGSDGLLFYGLRGDAVGVFLRESDNTPCPVTAKRKNIYGLCDDDTEIVKLKLKGY